MAHKIIKEKMIKSNINFEMPKMFINTIERSFLSEQNLSP